MNFMKNIPNLITCLNLFSGCLACVMALRGNYTGALFFVIMAAVFDFFDGFVARLLKAYSDIGKELDSLADVVSFGMAPGLVVYSFILSISTGLPFSDSMPFFAFLIPIFSAVRLAKFNIDTRQTTSFLGLPVPADGLFWCSLIPAIYSYTEGREILLLVILFCLIIVFCLLMISEIPMFSLKFKNYRWKGNEWRYALIILAIGFASFLHLFGISLTICMYILMSLFQPKEKA